MSNAHTSRPTRLNMEKCPPELAELINRHGNVANAAKATGLSKWTMRDIGGGRKPFTEKFKAKVLEALATKTNGASHPNPPPVIATSPFAPLGAVPEWDGARRSVKYKAQKGKIKTERNLPSPVADLLEMHHGMKAQTARAAGYSGWGGMALHFKPDAKYRKNLHQRVMKALRGDAPTTTPTATADQGPDEYRTGFAIVILSLKDYERIDEMAAIIGGHRIFRKSTKAGWVVFYKFAHRDKTEQFKRLATRDASEIVCP